MAKYVAQVTDSLCLHMNSWQSCWSDWCLILVTWVFVVTTWPLDNHITRPDFMQVMIWGHKVFICLCVAVLYRQLIGQVIWEWELLLEFSRMTPTASWWNGYSFCLVVKMKLRTVITWLNRWVITPTSLEKPKDMAEGLLMCPSNLLLFGIHPNTLIPPHICSRKNSVQQYMCVTSYCYDQSFFSC